ncbi:uncharacterized protein LOC116154650 isoform X1 [Camelus dromedarius]|uniref:uncharacterized protein LOC116154650 isoform X1 n=1 Tax=Camelus dromedarius TaxID=9838 RepID=UPI00311A8258
MKGKAPFRVWAGPEGEATGISSTAVARAGLAEAGQAPATSQPQSGRPDPVRSLTGTGLSAMPVRMLMMTLEKSSMGVLVLVKKTMFMRMMQRQKLEVLAMRRKAQAKSILIHMSMGFMMLALVLCLVLLPTMSLSFRPVFRRLNKADLVFSSLSLSIGFLIVLSLTLFVVNCETLQPRPQVSYLMTTYLCWSGGALMLWAGALSYLNHVGMWGRGMTSMERRLSYRRWVSQQSTQRSTLEQPRSDQDSKCTEDVPQFTSLPKTLP